MQSEGTDRTTSSAASSGPPGERESSVTLRRAKAALDDLRQSAHVADQLALPENLCEELHVAVEKAALRSAGSMNALHLAVRRFTVALRNDGAKPETVLIALKSVINSRTFAVGDNRNEDWSPEELRQQISTWSIQEFFGEQQA